jgi:hypothetical protein
MVNLLALNTKNYNYDEKWALFQNRGALQLFAEQMKVFQFISVIILTCKMESYCMLLMLLKTE